MAAALVLLEARDTTRRVARTFALACRMLPSAVRDDVYLLHLVFRTLDDLVDDGDPDAADRVAAVEAWCSGGAGPRTREVAILEELAERHPLPVSALRDFCTGMRQDLAAEPLPTEAALDRYCYRVAGTVGIVMAVVLGTRDAERARPAASALGMAMQRTNILRDIDEDLANGRIYLASESIVRFGGSLEPAHRGALVRDGIVRADVLYDRGMAGIPLLANGRRAIAAAAGMYRGILRQIERDGYGERGGRGVVPCGRKFAVAARRGSSPADRGWGCRPCAARAAASTPAVRSNGGGPA